MEPESDAVIIGASLAEPERFAGVFDRHSERIHGYLARRVGRDDADALLGDVFRIAFQNRGRYDLSRVEAAPWLYGIASNLVRQHRRAEQRQLRLATRLASVRVLDDPGPEHDVDAVTDASMAMKLIAGLDDGERDVVLLYAWEDLSYAQIAEALDVPIGTVRSRLSRARARIRRQLDAREAPAPGEEGSS
jgi:RNA polymerase sigma-70 factor (ECF subfamily)